MKPTIPTILVLAAAVSIFTGCQTTPSTPVGFLKADANHDGKLSRAESSDYFVTKIFDGVDANHDGKVTLEEWSVKGVKGAKERFHAIDSNHDGALSLAEVRAAGQHRKDFGKFFAEADTNKDGGLSLAETQAYYASKEGPVR